MGVDKIIRNRLAKMEGRIRREGRRLASVLLCASLVMGNLTVTPFSILADDESGDYDYEFDRMSLKEALRTALSEGATLEKELNFDGQYAEEYDKLLTPDGTLYELFPEETEKDRERDKVLDLRIFARVQGSIPVEDTYVFDGSEEIVFLLTNKTDKTQTATIYIDEMQSETITVLPADSIAVDDESSNRVVSGLHSSGGGSGSGTGSGSGSVGTIQINNTSDSIQLDGDIVQDSDVTVLESEADTADKENMDHPTADDNDIVIDDSHDQDNEQTADTDSRESGMEAAGKDERKDSAEAAKEDEEVSGSDSGVDKTNEDAGADTDDIGADIDDTGTDTDDVDSNSADDADGKDDTDVEDGSDTDDNDNNDEVDDSDSSDVDDSVGDTSDDTSDSSDSDELASISLHRTALLSASIASASNAVKKKTTDDTASPSDATASDADRMLDGTLYEAVRLDKKGAVAFVTTGADCRFDVIVLEEQEMTCESESSDQEYLVTVKGWLPQGATITAEPVDVEIADKVVLLALDISIYDDNGEVFEPADGSISVKIESPEITSEETGESFDVYYVPEEGEPELMPVTESEEGNVTFEAEHFSTYVVTSSDTVEATGTIDNAEGTGTITWTVYKDSESGDRTLVISGEGSIPDYTSGTLTPWYSYCNTSNTTLELVIEDGITAIGAYAFHQTYLSEVSFPDTLTSIGRYAFCYSRSLTSVVIPDSVTFIGTYAFTYSHIMEIKLGNGVQTIESFAFYVSINADYNEGGITVYLPDSLTSLGADAFNQACAYEVSDGNTNYKVIDGVLYSYDGTTLIDFPKYKVLDTYTVPSEVTKIATGALRYVGFVNSLVIDHVVTFENSGYSMSNSNYQSIYLADGIEITGNAAFLTDTNLSEIRLPEGTKFTFNVSCLGGDSSLTSLKIPDGTTSLQNQSLSGLTGLETLYYDATNASEITENVFGGTSGISYDLIVGTSVNVLPVGFNYLATKAETLNFEGPNALYVTEGALANAPAPFTGISGWIYVDEYGAVYQLDVDSDTATLIYVPDDVTAYTVPTSFAVSGESDETVNADYQVATVASNALKYADSLTSITFEDASQVTLEAYALANCETLMSVTNNAASEDNRTATTVSAAEALGFASVGKNAFYNTGLTSNSTVISESSLNGGQYAIATLSNATQEAIATVSATVTEGGTWTAANDGTGGYVALTGETMTVNINAGNSSGSAQTYRVYFNITDDDFQMNYKVGETFTITSGGNVISISCVQDPDDPYAFYYEFTLASHQTVNFNVTTNYLSGSSDGGGLTVSTAIVETTTDEDGGTTVTDKATSDSTMQLWWKTEQDDYTLTKTNTSNQDSIKISADEDGAYLASNLQYTITLHQDADKHSSQGEDYVTGVEYTDVITLPDGVTWDADVLEAIRKGSYTRSTGNTTTFSVNGVAVVTLKMTADSGLLLQKAQLSVNDEGKVVLT